MIGDVQMKVGGTAFTARLEYNSIVLKGIKKLRRRLSRIIELPKTASPAFAVAESVERVTVEFEVPGYGPDDLSLEVKSHSVRLRCPEGCERRSPFDLSVQVPESVVADQVAASLQNGVLTVDLPKLAWVKGTARRIPVKVSPSGPEDRGEGASAGVPDEHRRDADPDSSQ